MSGVDQAQLAVGSDVGSERLSNRELRQRKRKRERAHRQDLYNNGNQVVTKVSKTVHIVKAPPPPSSPPICELCTSTDCTYFQFVLSRVYWRCNVCDLIFMLPEYRLSNDLEKARYDAHENDTNSSGYRNFLNKMAKPLLPLLKPHSKGIDYGCGPGPLLSIILAEAGHEVANYDPFYFQDESVLSCNSYDFVTCTETAEHFYHPRIEFERMNGLLKDGDDAPVYIGIMTESPPISFIDEDKKKKNDENNGSSSFQSWYYVRDPTHVCFYSLKTMKFIANKFDWALVFHQGPVYVFRKSRHPIKLDTDLDIDALIQTKNSPSPSPSPSSSTTTATAAPTASSGSSSSSQSP